MKKLRLNKTTLRDLSLGDVYGGGVYLPTISVAMPCCETQVCGSGQGPLLPSLGGPSGCVACLTK